jgi:outer membrane protein insertion porin family
VRFDIVEGEVAKIRQISIIGNQVFREKDLLGLFKLRTPGLMTWFSKDDQYSKQKLCGGSRDAALLLSGSRLSRI